MCLGSWPEPLTCLVFPVSQLPSKALVPEMEDEDEEDDSEDAINEFDFLGSGEDGEVSPDPRRCAGEGTHHELGEWRVFCPPSSARVVGAHSHLQPLPAQGLHRMVTLPDRRVAKESWRPTPQWSGLHLLPAKPVGTQAGLTLPEVGLPALCARVSRSWWTPGRK